MGREADSCACRCGVWAAEGQGPKCRQRDQRSPRGPTWPGGRNVPESSLLTGQCRSVSHRSLQWRAQGGCVLGEMETVHVCVYLTDPPRDLLLKTGMMAAVGLAGLVSAGKRSVMDLRKPLVSGTGHLRSNGLLPRLAGNDWKGARKKARATGQHVKQQSHRCG